MNKMTKNTWTRQYIDNDMMWPSENLIRMFKGKNYPDCHLSMNDYTHASLLDVGCGDANNFPLYSQLGFKKLCGVEITEEICQLNEERLSRMGIYAEMRVGTNDAIPWEETFDYLVSWNAGYYMGVLDHYFMFEDYLEEFSRVLKKNGIFIFSIPMSDHDIFLHSETINEKYSVIQEDMLGIRNGVVFRKFKDEKDLRETLALFFEDIHLGSIRDNYFGVRGNWHIGYCRK